MANRPHHEPDLYLDIYQSDEESKSEQKDFASQISGNESESEEKNAAKHLSNHEISRQESYSHTREAKHRSQSQQDTDTNSLGYLTKQFILLLKNKKPGQFINLDEVGKKLNVQKRRIYDITNVLEGIGYIDKVGKNLMQWVGGTNDGMRGQSANLDRKIEELEAKEKELDAKMEIMNRKIHAINEGSVRNYFTIKELGDVMKKLGCKQMIVYKGNEGVQICVSQNSVTGKKQIIIQSPPKSQVRLGRFWELKKEEKSGSVIVAPIFSQAEPLPEESENHKQHDLIKQEKHQSEAQHGEVQDAEDPDPDYQDQQKREVEESSLRQNQQKSSTFQDEEKIFKKTDTLKPQKQPGLKSQQALKKGEKGPKKRGRKSNQVNKQAKASQRQFLFDIDKSSRQESENPDFEIYYGSDSQQQNQLAKDYD